MSNVVNIGEFKEKKKALLAREQHEKMVKMTITCCRQIEKISSDLNIVISRLDEIQKELKKYSFIPDESEKA